MLREVFIYKKRDTSKKARQFSFSVIYTEILTLCVTQFFLEILKLAERGGHFYKKNNALCVEFLFAKNNALCDTFLLTKSPSERRAKVV